LDVNGNCDQTDPKNLGGAGGGDGGDVCVSGGNMQGNPINAGWGNKFQEETDIRSSKSGGLKFVRYYNGVNNVLTSSNSRWRQKWTDTYYRSVAVVVANQRVVVYREDGRSYRFNKNGTVWVPDADVNATLTQLSSGEWRFSKANGEVETYASNGRLKTVVDRYGYTQTLFYSNNPSGDTSYFLDDNFQPSNQVIPDGWLIRVEDSLGRKLLFDYQGYGFAMLTGPSGERYKYRFNHAGALTSVTYPDGKVRQYIYNESAYAPGSVAYEAKLTGIIDENGNRFATYKYDEQGRAISSEHNLANGESVEKVSIAYTTDASGAVTSSTVTDALNTTRTYSFNNVLGVVKNTGVTQPCASGCGTNSATTYDANGNVASKTDFNGNITTYQYDLTRNLETSRTEAFGTPLARTIGTQWHATLRLPTLISEPGKTTAFSYDANGNLLSKTITDTAVNKSRTWTYTYNSLGQVLTANGPRTDVNDVTTYAYYTSASSTPGGVHSIGDLATVTNALGHVTSITNYDLNGRPLTIVDPNNVATTLTYTPRGWLKSRTVNGAQTTTYDYDGVGQLTKATLPDGSYLQYTYDTAHRLTDVTDNAGNTIHYTLDAMGNRLKEDSKDPSGSILKTRSRAFDALNRLQRDIGGTSPSTQITQYAYDNNGNLQTLTDPLNHITTNAYDALNRLISVTDPANGVSTTTYNALDQVTAVADPRLVTTNYTINALGDVTLTQSPDSGNTNNVYDAAGNLVQKTDARGVVSNYSYDALNRLVSIAYPASPAEDVTFNYDDTVTTYYRKGRLAYVTSSGSNNSLVFSYDAYGNIVTQADISWTAWAISSYQYDSANRLQQITHPNGRIVIYTRNALGQITQVQTRDNANAAPVTIIANATYEPFGPVKSLTFGNGVTTTIQHDADYRVGRITTSSSPVWDYVYSYDAAGNITSQSDQVGTAHKAFGYDNLNRVTSDGFGAAGAPYGYTYDETGNRLTGGFAFFPYSQTYAASSNRLTRFGSTNKSSDASGNLLQDANGGTLTHDNANRLAQWTKNGITRGYQYNGLGWRNIKTGGQITHYAYLPDGKTLSQMQLNNDGSYSQGFDYIWLDDVPVAQIKTAYTTNNTPTARRLTYIHADHLNTPRAMTDANRIIVWKWYSDAYGLVAPNANPDGDSTTDTLDLRFPGQIYDSESGLFYNLNRYYDPMLGRYTQYDPIGLAGGLNPYAYVDGNPVNYIDPDGLQVLRPINRVIPRGYPRPRPQTPEQQARREYRKDCDTVQGCPLPDLTEEYCEWICPGEESNASCPVPGPQLKKMPEDDPRCYCVMKTRINPAALRE